MSATPTNALNFHWVEAAAVGSLPPEIIGLSLSRPRIRSAAPAHQALYEPNLLSFLEIVVG
jgi:hypothetical protein